LGGYWGGHGGERGGARESRDHGQTTAVHDDLLCGMASIPLAD
jgi:hypothetical protein